VLPTIPHISCVPDEIFSMSSLVSMKLVLLYESGNLLAMLVVLRCDSTVLNGQADFLSYLLGYAMLLTSGFQHARHGPQLYDPVSSLTL